jgi:hypothetical protein
MKSLKLMIVPGGAHEQGEGVGAAAPDLQDRSCQSRPAVGNVHHPSPPGAIVKPRVRCNHDYLIQLDLNGPIVSAR